MSRLEGQMDGEQDAEVRLQMQRTLDGYQRSRQVGRPGPPDAPDAAELEHARGDGNHLLPDANHPGQDIETFRRRRIAEATR